MSLALLLVAAFLVGGIPFAYLAVLAVFRVDVRKHGSGNPGATNASRMWSKRWQFPVFAAIFLLDAGKGYVTAGVLPRLFDGLDGYAPAAAGAAAVLGHTFSPFLGFRGGKGVATTMGALLALEPLATAIALAVFLLIWVPTRIVAAGSLGIAVALPVAVWLHGKAPDAVLVLAIVLGVLIVVRHRSNIARMLSGEET